MMQTGRIAYRQHLWLLETPPAGSSVWVFKTNAVSCDGHYRSPQLPSGVTLRMVLRGGCSVRVGEAVFHARAGDVFCAVPGVEIEFASEPGQAWAWCEFQVTGPGAMEVVHACGCAPDDPVARPADVESAVQGFCDLHRLLGRADREPHAVMALLHRILTACGHGAYSSSGGSSPRARLVAQATALLDAQPQMRMNVSEMARHLGVDRVTVQRAFKREVGLSPIAFIRRQRIERAKELLRSTDWSVREVAEATGFANAKYFIRVFREATGRTPGVWRKR